MFCSDINECWMYTPEWEGLAQTVCGRKGHCSQLAEYGHEAQTFH